MFLGFFGNSYVARGVRTIGVGFLAFTIYGAGYHSGVTDFVKDPEGIISQARDYKVVDKEHPESKRVQRIGKRIIEAAKQYCDEKLTIAQSAGSRSDVEYWEAAVKRLCGQWSINYLDVPTPNAFVSNLLSRHIFIHQGLVKELKPTDEELALLMAHEISHVIHNHSYNLSVLEGVLAAVQLISFVLVDPSGGLWIYFFDYAFANLESYYYASYSREAEKEADMTGIQIVAKACYETRGASKIFLRSSAHSRGANRYSWGWTKTHPSGTYRDSYLSKESEVHNPEKHGAQCHRISQYLQLFQKKVIQHPIPPDHHLLTDHNNTAQGSKKVE